MERWPTAFADDVGSRDLALVSDVAMALAETADLAPALEQCVCAVVDRLDAAFARIWTVDPTGEWLELRASAGAHEHLDGPHARVRVGELKVGRIAAERLPHVTNDVLGDPQIHDHEWARREGLVAFAGYPLTVAERLVGVLALFARRPLQSDTHAALGSIARAIAVRVDRARTETKLVAAEVRLSALAAEDRVARTIADNATMALFVMDHRQHCTFMNRAAEALTGFTLEEVRVRNVPLHDIIHYLHPDGRPYPMSDCPIDRALPTRARETGEDVFVHRDGHFYSVAFTASPLTTNGVAVGTVIEVRDTTAEKRAEEVAALLVHASTALASTLDYRRTVPEVLARMVPLLGGWVGVWVGHDASESKLLAEAHDGFGTAMLDERPPDLETRAIPAIPECEELGITSWLVVPLTAHGRPLGRLALARARGGRRDPTDRATVEEIARRIGIAIDNTRLFELSQEERRRAEEASRAKDELLAVTSHELRTPLNAILGWARLLRSGILDETKHARALETIERNARAQVHLVEDLLDVSRALSGRLRLDRVAVDVGQVVLAAIDVVRPAAIAKGVRLEQLGSAAAIVRGDADRLQQVVWNLLSNAVKFTPKGGRVDVSVTHDADHVEIVVRDDGQGIGVEFTTRIFEPFRQEDSSVTRTHGGLGLGLAIVEHLVELHGGTVRAESAGPGKGASFFVRLPRAPEHTSAVMRPPAAPEGECVTEAASIPGAKLEGVRVLVVDDEPDAVDLVRSILEQQGARVTTTTSAHEALARFEAEVPDIVVSDLGMPGESGFGLIRRIRVRTPDDGGRVPAIALTAYASVSDRTRALQEGFTSHVAKPTEPAELVAVVSAILLTSKQSAAPSG